MFIKDGALKCAEIIEKGMDKYSITRTSCVLGVCEGRCHEFCNYKLVIMHEFPELDVYVIMNVILNSFPDQ